MNAEYIAVQLFYEDDGSVTLSTKDLDLVVNGPDLPRAKAALVRDLMEYAAEYDREVELYGRAPNRKDHLPYVRKALAAQSPKELEDVIRCENGRCCL